MSTPATRLYGIDIANLNGLVIDIRERLSGGLTGDFYEKGGVIKEGVRHAQLPILFGAMAQVDTLVSALEKQAVIAEAEEPKDAQKSGGKLNKNMMATIKEMVHAEVEMRTRTISIENERMKAVVQKLEVQNAKLVDEVASVKSKQKKSGGQPASGSDEKYHALGKKLEGLQKIQKQNEAGQSALARKLDAMQAEFLRFGSTAFKAAEVVAKIEGLSEQMKDAISDLRVCESDLWKVERDLRACEGNALENGKKCDSNAKIFELRHVELVGAAIEVQQRLGLPVQARHVAADWVNEQGDQEKVQDEGAQLKQKKRRGAAPPRASDSSCTGADSGWGDCNGEGFKAYSSEHVGGGWGSDDGVYVASGW